MVPATMTPSATMRPSPLLRAAVLTAGLLLVPPAAWSESAKKVFRQAAPSVVVVLALGRNGATTGQGSGVVVGRTEVVTNCHVVEEAASLAVRQASDHTGGTTWRMKASVLAQNDERDLCLLHVEELSDPPAPTTARLGSAKTLSVGEEVYAIGAPRGLELSLSRGIVSQLRGVLGKRRGPLIQTDAAISSGSSGGGLFNANGELVGITTFKWRGENLNFALPADWVQELRERGRSAVETAEMRAACEEDPDFECLVVLARREADGIEDAHRRGFALSSVVGTQVNIAGVQLEANDTQGAKLTLALALKTAQEIDEAMWRGYALSDIAAAQAKAGEQQAARKTFADALKAAQEIDDTRFRGYALETIASTQDTSSIVLRSIAAAQAKAGNVANALKTARNIDEATWRGYALRHIAVTQAKAGNVIDALKITQEIDDASPRASALKDIAAAQAKAGEQQAATRTFADALKAAQEIDDARSHASALNNIAAAQAKAGEQQAATRTFADALKAAQEIDDAWFRASALQDIAIAQTKARNVVDVLKTTRGIDDAGSRASVLKNIAAAQAKAGEPQAASRTFAAAFDAAQDIDASYERLEAFTDILSTQAEAKNVKDAIKAFKNAVKVHWTGPSEAALKLDRPDRVLVQRGLASLGKDVGAADGVFGTRTRAALRSWQVDAGFKATGHLTREQADRLIAAGRAAEAAQRLGSSQRLKEFCAEVPQSALCRDL